MKGRVIATMIIGVCGFVSTGSSAVSDYLKEFGENKVIDSFEFVLPYFPDGLEDLEYHLMKNFSKYFDSVVAIERFRRVSNYLLNRETNGKSRIITDKYLDDITQVKWKGFGCGDAVLYNLWIHKNVILRLRTHVSTLLNRMTGRRIKTFLCRNMELSMKPDNFYEASKKYVSDLIKLLVEEERKNIVLDQPFAGSNPKKSFKFFDSPKAIVVDRDPRDNYIFAKKFLLNKGFMIPTDTVEQFVTYYRNLRKDIINFEHDSNILKINFEDMIYEYQGTTAKIRSFCELTESGKPFTIFDPKLSINNTQLIKRYPEYIKDVEYIEKELTKYLYPFEKYPLLEQPFGKMFYGKSPLN